MHRAVVAIALMLVACATPSGRQVPQCDASWTAVQPVIVVPAQAEATPVAIDCMAEIDESRIRVGFRMPAGPSCHRLGSLGIGESAGAVSVSVGVVVVNDPLAGACSDEPMRVVTEADLQAPVGDRALLDGSR